jgi:hypothetical protein
MAQDESGEAATTEVAKDPAEQESLARTLATDLTEIFIHFVRGDVGFADVTFETYEALQDLYIIASGDYELEYEDAEEYDVIEATEEQEDLSQEPARGES